ncbi:MAG: hypothetical protein WC076_02715 [Terrimicrobiaceae bacterium]
MRISDFRFSIFDLKKCRASHGWVSLHSAEGRTFLNRQSAIENRQFRRSAAAFTLVELLVACVLLMFLVLLLFNVFSSVAASYQQTESRADSYRDGRAALYLLSGELKTLVDAGGGLTNTNATPLPRLEVQTGTNASLAFVTELSPASQPSTNAPGDICMVGYFVADQTNAPKGRSLYRCLIPSGETYSRMENSGNTLLEPADLSPDAPYTEPVANNVVDFQVKVLDSELQEISNPTGGTNEAYVQINLTVIGTRNAQAYFQDGAPDTLKQRIREKDARTFTLRSKLRTAPN